MSNVQINEVVAIENQKISDWMEVNLSFSLDELTRSAQHHGIDTFKPQIKESVIQESSKAEIAIAEAKYEKYKPSDEICQQLIEEGLLLGEAKLEENGNLVFQYFLLTQKLVQKYTSMVLKDF